VKAKHSIIALVTLLWPGAAHACAVCFSATDENRTAFLVTTIVLSLLPLGMITSALWWLKRHSDDVGLGFHDDDDAR
jgi:hypothetical protein